MINFIIDENLSFELIKFLKSKGFPAKHIKKRILVEPKMVNYTK